MFWLGSRRGRCGQACYACPPEGSADSPVGDATRRGGDGAAAGDDTLFTGDTRSGILPVKPQPCLARCSGLHPQKSNICSLRGKGLMGVSRLALHIEHFTADQVTGLANHNYYKRGKKDEHSNQDIDPALSHLNMALVVPENDEKLRQSIKADIDNRVTGRVTKASIWVSEHIVYPPEDLTERDELEQYFKDLLDFYYAKYGKENIKLAVVHMDETTPHIHIDTVPITQEGKLSRKEIYTRKAINDLHTDLAAYLKECGWDIERGESTKDKGVKAKTVKEYKKAKNKEYNALVKDYNQLVDEYNALKDSLGDDTGKTITAHAYVTTIESRQRFFKSSEVIYDKEDAKALQNAAESAIGYKDQLIDMSLAYNKQSQKLSDAEARERLQKKELEKEKQLRLAAEAREAEQERLMQYYQQTHGINLWDEDLERPKTLLRVALEAAFIMATGERILSEGERKVIEQKAKQQEQIIIEQQDFEKKQQRIKAIKHERSR